MRLLVSIFLHSFLLDAALSVASEWLPIATLQSGIAWIVFALGLAMYVLTAFVPRLPKRLLLPPVIFLIWTNICVAFPLAFVAPDYWQYMLAWTQLFFAIGLVIVHQRWRHIPPLGKPAFSWRTFALVTIPTLVAIPFVLAAAIISQLGFYLESQSGGYAKLRPAGVLMEEREFTKDGKRVRLMGMMHIGEKKIL